MTPHQLTTARHFYRKGRRTFVPMTAEDMCFKSKWTPDEAQTALTSLRLAGFAVCPPSRGGKHRIPVIYNLTEEGRERVLQAMMEESV